MFHHSNQSRNVNFVRANIYYCKIFILKTTDICNDKYVNKQPIELGAPLS